MNRRPIQFDCHYCLNSVSAWQDQCGHEIPCPHCQTQLMVPSQPIDVSLFDDIFDSLNPQESPSSESPKVADSAKQQALGSSTVNQMLDEATQPKTARSGPSPSVPVVQQAAQPQSSQATQPPVSDPAAESFGNQSIEKSVDDELQEYVETLNVLEAKPEERLRVEGLDLGTAEEVISLKCKICDSRIHTPAATLNTEIECPECFTRILVTASRVEKPANQMGLANARDTRLSFSGKTVGQLDQEEPVDLQLIPLKMDVAESVATPAPTFREREPAMARPDARSVVKQPEEDQPSTSASPSPAGKPMSRREKYEAAQRRLATQNAPASRRLKTKKETVPAGESADPQSSLENKPATKSSAADPDEVPIEYSVNQLMQMLGSPGLRMRIVLVGLMLGLGSGLMHQFGQRTGQLSEPSIAEWFMSTLTWAGLGLLPYLTGVGLLWLLCGFVFREAANGQHQILNWKLKGWAELQNTFLLVGFSFFIAGLPFSVIPMMYSFVTPLRFLIAPLLLVAAWYNQSGWAIVGVDAFQNVGREKNQWGQFYLLVMGLAAMSFIGGLLMTISYSGLAFLTSLVGALIIAISTVGFSAAAGWHCGWVVQGVRGRNR